MANENNEEPSLQEVLSPKECSLNERIFASTATLNVLTEILDAMRDEIPVQHLSSFEDAIHQVAIAQDYLTRVLSRLDDPKCTCGADDTTGPYPPHEPTCAKQSS